jgi:hypothetical protein
MSHSLWVCKEQSQTGNFRDPVSVNLFLLLHSLKLKKQKQKQKQKQSSPRKVHCA